MLSTDTVSLSPNPSLANARGSPRRVHRADIIRYIEDNGSPDAQPSLRQRRWSLKTSHNFAIQSKRLSTCPHR